MKRKLPLLLILAFASAASAQMNQLWTPGWKNFKEPTNYAKSDVAWSVNSTTRQMAMTFNLVCAGSA
jgi:hypothetical protein